MEFQARVAAPSNVAISGATLGMTIDGLVINALDKVLLPNQTNPNESTLYEMTPSGLLVRSAPSLDADTEVVVFEGTGKGRWEYSPTQGKFYLQTATLAGQAVVGLGASNTGNTSGNTGTKPGTWVLAGSNAITVNESTGTAGINTLWLNASQSLQSAVGGLGVITTNTLYNQSGNDGIITAHDYILAGSGGITISQATDPVNPNTLWIQHGAHYTLSEYSPSDMQLATQTSQLGQNTLYFAPFDLAQPLSAYRMNLFGSVGYTMSGGASSGSGGRTISAALYQRGTGTNTTQLTRVWSQSQYFNFSASSNTNMSLTYPSGIANSTSVNQVGFNQNNGTASDYINQRVAGNRVMPMCISSVMTPGRYWLALAMSSGQSNASYDVGVSMYGEAVNSNNAFVNLGLFSSATNAGFWGQLPGEGVYSATSGAFPVTVPIISDTIRNQASAFFPLFNFSAYTTATNYL